MAMTLGLGAGLVCFGIVIGMVAGVVGTLMMVVRAACNDGSIKRGDWY